jgi:hypothetical protein
MNIERPREREGCAPGLRTAPTGLSGVTVILSDVGLVSKG